MPSEPTILRQEFWTETILRCQFIVSMSPLMPTVQPEDVSAPLIKWRLSKASSLPSSMHIKVSSRVHQKRKAIGIFKNRKSKKYSIKIAQSKATQAQSKWKVQAGIIPPTYSVSELFPEWTHLTVALFLHYRQQTEDGEGLLVFKPKPLTETVSKTSLLYCCCLVVLFRVISLNLGQYHATELSATVKIFHNCLHNRLATCHMWPLSPWNVATATKELILKTSMIHV